MPKIVELNENEVCCVAGGVDSVNMGNNSVRIQIAFAFATVAFMIYVLPYFEPPCRVLLPTSLHGFCDVVAHPLDIIKKAFDKAL